MNMTNEQLQKSAARQSSGLTGHEKIILAFLTAKSLYGITGIDKRGATAIKNAYQNMSVTDDIDVDSFIDAKTAVDLFINDTMARSEELLGEESYAFAFGALSQLMAEYVAFGKIPNAIKKYMGSSKI